MVIETQTVLFLLGGIGVAIAALGKFLRDLFKATSTAEKECHKNYTSLNREVGELKGKQEGLVQGVNLTVEKVLLEIAKTNKDEESK